MTQEYTPTELNENTPEPTADGIYLLTITMGDETRTYPATKEGDMWLTDDDCTWKDLLSEMSQADRVNIQSLAAHDAQIRADEHVKALELSDDETQIFANEIHAFTHEWGSFLDCDLEIGLDAIAEYRKEQQ